jgi:DMSO/TMAO reductase YedYZ molybdopterin-dependent catalytic subunit
MTNIISRAFRGRRREPEDRSDRVPPGQYLVNDFPVLTAGPTPHTPQDKWDFTVEVKEGAGAGSQRRWTWEELTKLPSETFTTDIHCVTRWSKLDTTWTGVSVDTLLDGLEHDPNSFVIAFCDGGYTTNMPLSDVTGRKAWVVYSYDNAPLPIEHGGPARLLVPHLYLWKSAKWVRGLRLQTADQRGFWEMLGYHDRGDPWKEQRYWGD